MRLIDADAIAPKLEGKFNQDMVRYAPTIDAVPVVRCQYCKHRIDDTDFASGHYCTKRPSNGGRFCEDNDFCSYGERRSDD